LVRRPEVIVVYSLSFFVIFDGYHGQATLAK